MKLTPKDIYAKKAKKEKITSLSLYDFPTARIADEAGVDILMAGDSAGMVLLGHKDTCQMTMENMLYHTSAVAKAVQRALVVADMPYRSYEDPETALKNAKRFIEEAGADAVKLEGGVKILPQVRKLLASGIPVMGHVGMLPQAAGSQFHVRGRTDAEARSILEDARALDEAGVFSIVLECVPAKLGEEVTRAVKCPTIGIGAGPATDGQILVLHDILGIRTAVSPRFVRQYAAIEKEIKNAVQRYCTDVTKGKFPSAKESF